jgi:hypothetical protein
VYSHYNLCNIPIYFYNIDIQYLQHIYETSKTLQTYYFNMHFQHGIYLLLGPMEAHRRGVQRRHGARYRGVARRSPVWISSAAHTLAKGRGRRMEHADDGRHESGRGPSRSRGTQHAERAGTQTGSARARRKVSGRLI